MDKGKLNIFRGLYRRETTPEQRALKIQEGKLKQEAALVKGLTQHAGWKLLDEFFQKKQAVLAMEFKTCKPEQLNRLQEKSKIIDEFYAFLNTKLIRDPDL